MSGLNGVSGSSDPQRVRPATAPMGGAAEPAPGYAADGYVAATPRVRVGPPIAAPKATDPTTFGLFSGAGVFGLGAAALLASAFMGAPLLGAMTMLVGGLAVVPALVMLGLGLARAKAKRDAAAIGER